MKDVLVVGSIALDSVKTPYGEVTDVLGGSATYFSYAASFFTRVRLVGIVGMDFPERFRDLLSARNIDTKGLRVVDGKTFRWSGCYQGDMNAAETLSVDLNVFGEFQPDVPEEYRDSEYVFLANGAPSTQMKLLEQVKKPKFVVADTMNLWIENARQDLMKIIERVDGLVLNDGEARMLTGDDNLIRAGRAVCKRGPKFVVIKKGEHGALVFTEDKMYSLPGYPLSDVKDPTGAGDSFAGGMMGYIAKADDLSPETLKQAVAMGTIVASFNVEDFTLRRFQSMDSADIEKRYSEFVEMLRFK